MQALRAARIVIVLHLICLVGRSSFAEDAEPRSESTPAHDFIRSYASERAPLGSPEYTAAIRAAMMLTADSLATSSGQFDLTRTISIPRPQLRESSEPVLKVDGDDRYLSWLLQESNHAVVQLGITGCANMQTRVVGGNKIRNSECFSEVALAFESSTKPFCSAVLINTRTLLTAAHCVCDVSMQYAVFGLNLDDPQAYRIAINGQKIHEGVKCRKDGATEEEQEQSLIGEDIALLWLGRDVPSNIAQPRVLPSIGAASTLYANGNHTLVVVGFGYTEADPKTPEWLVDQKQKTFGMTGIISIDCAGGHASASDSTTYGCGPGKEILAKDPHLVGPCPGDSGGGAYMLSDQSGTMVPVLVGVTSRSILQHVAPCGDGAIYTALTTETLSWISHTMASSATTTP
jgi:secreted trypsin-like serine protease